MKLNTDIITLSSHFLACLLWPNQPLFCVLQISVLFFHAAFQTVRATHLFLPITALPSTFIFTTTSIHIDCRNHILIPVIALWWFIGVLLPKRLLIKSLTSRNHFQFFQASFPYWNKSRFWNLDLIETIKNELFHNEFCRTEWGKDIFHRFVTQVRKGVNYIYILSSSLGTV